MKRKKPRKTSGCVIKLSAQELKQRLYNQGKTLKSFAEEHGFKYRTVSEVIRGLRRGNFGEGRKVRIALGLPVND